MSRTLFFAILASAAAFLACPGTINAEETKPAMTTETKTLPKPQKSGLLPINGVNYYYAIYGKGEPLLLLHGGLGSIDMFAPILAKLAENRTVIGVDLQGHGRTALGDRPFTLEAIGDDMAGIVKTLGYDKVDVMGYSLGGGVAFRMAVQHPEVVRRLVLVSTGYAADGFYDEMRPQQAQVSAAAAAFMKETPMYKSYVAVAPHPEDFPKLLDALGNFMRQNYDFSADVPKLKMPVMLAYGDSDMYKPEHEIKFYQMLGGGLKDAGWMRENLSQNRLAILPNRTHYDVFFAPELTAAALPFLDGQTKVKSWDEVVGEAE
ncbi:MULTISPECIES: alpha/beta hydrolase [unclassified Mesorhizobium]|uniref:alpha/beta fold hydrolase n=1 Tax=unclassified Mesorhizobium TaxID=325217 RepID=UPI000FDB3FA9|nr:MULTISPECIES: alpha/beta hydrolase [unclassified Mesorhizobium]TGR58307.1 alpha/beta hydrolase [bacterium M00.F.Ca.ET.199.01.1.1]TGU41584.1 alpha/beta hydrolase [bacterium M00.F.Ca.ET.156.01.1.1]TGV89792.1 alpha/beta hydrolase [Mesorhizobium sp. M00.F.Ca.ET.149.01.1.1]TGR33050.1 alpha/beta hydrolase [Mesorhizobium sp. M8A.F.Ca.ET.197.01.1.1]TGR34696.1 alpha/beta hydrolase [Mesorhizobium sp. M8A.F.Ca.ET.202.01.1.1]